MHVILIAVSMDPEIRRREQKYSIKDSLSFEGLPMFFSFWDSRLRYVRTEAQSIKDVDCTEAGRRKLAPATPTILNCCSSRDICGHPTNRSWERSHIGAVYTSTVADFPFQR